MNEREDRGTKFGQHPADLVPCSACGARAEDVCEACGGSRVVAGVDPRTLPVPAGTEDFVFAFGVLKQHGFEAVRAAMGGVDVDSEFFELVAVVDGEIESARRVRRSEETRKRA